jgi:Sjoegren syndrome nuclear autoantigen 1
VKQTKQTISPRSTAAPRQPYLLIASRAQVNRQIVKDEEEKAKIQNDLRMLTERLSRVNDSVARKVASRNE